MAISENHLNKLVELFQNEDISFTMDAISIIESLIYTEEDFRELLEKIGKKKIPEIPTIEELREVFGKFTTDIQNYLSIWALGTLAQWNQNIRDNTTYLDLSSNELTSLPDSIGNLTNLTTLDLYSNKLTYLPDWIGNLTNITSLNLLSNKLTSLPDSIENLTNLTTLDLSYTPLPQPEEERIRKLLPNCNLVYN